ncbi:MAG: hypothetical protein A4E49_02762 [Methanosaeta sp. PtaU1.Bin112]|nr:MAG: hypothetical protein A4E49_02762 [Methanosaeta sp. PtaU1.Bin112]
MSAKNVSWGEFRANPSIINGRKGVGWKNMDACDFRRESRINDVKSVLLNHYRFPSAFMIFKNSITE